MNIETIRAICTALPAVTEDIKWGHDLVFSVGEKMFCVAVLDQSPTSVSLKVPDEEFDEITARPGFRPAPYAAQYKWILIDDIRRLRKAEWVSYIRQSYELVKNNLPEKLKRKIGVE